MHSLIISVCFYFVFSFSHILLWTVDANFIYISFHSYNLLFINTYVFNFSHILLFMGDANFIYIFQSYNLLLINSFFSSNHFVFHIYLPWMVDANFIFILVFISPYFHSVWHPFGCFIYGLFDLILCYLFATCFHHVHPKQ